MATGYWGVDSVAAADQPVPAVTGSIKLYDYLVKKGLKPSFFGRYLAGGTTNLTRDEADFLHTNGCAVLPVYQGGPVAGRNGTSDASKAIDLADTLGMARCVTIYRDVEPLEKPTPTYITDWCKRMWDSRYGGAGGFYCNNWVHSDFMKAFKQAYNAMDPGMRDNIYLWCQHPLRKKAGEWCSQTTYFGPDRPSFFPNGPNVWQYSLGCLPYKQGSHNYALIDMNSADADGFDAMWK